VQLFIYFHNDFDGTVSAALLTEILKKLGKFRNFVYKPVDFNLKNNWLNLRLEQPAAILDFFYHPDATYYYDHHESSIAEQFFGQSAVDNEEMCLNITYKSTPSVLKYKFADSFDFSAYADLLRWSDIIDNAEYTSPKDLYDSQETYISMNKLISYYQDRNNHEETIRIIPYILDAPDEYLAIKKELLAEISQKESLIIKSLRQEMKVEANISFVDQSEINFAVQRFVSYYYYPDLDYQIMIYRKNADYMVNFGRNPWKSFHSKNLGEIAQRYGGFGRKDVGGILVKTHSEAANLEKLITKDLLQ
jgi:hypothetical protein